jgi:hypothetical protein
LSGTIDNIQSRVASRANALGPEQIGFFHEIEFEPAQAITMKSHRILAALRAFRKQSDDDTRSAKSRDNDNECRGSMEKNDKENKKGDENPR